VRLEKAEQNCRKWAFGRLAVANLQPSQKTEKLNFSYRLVVTMRRAAARGPFAVAHPCVGTNPWALCFMVVMETCLLELVSLRMHASPQTL